MDKSGQTEMEMGRSEGNRDDSCYREIGSVRSEENKEGK